MIYKHVLNEPTQPGALIHIQLYPSFSCQELGYSKGGEGRTESYCKQAKICCFRCKNLNILFVSPTSAQFSKDLNNLVSEKFTWTCFRSAKNEPDTEPLPAVRRELWLRGLLLGELVSFSLVFKVDFLRTVEVNSGSSDIDIIFGFFSIYIYILLQHDCFFGFLH